MANLIAWVESLKTDLEIPGSIREAGVNEADFMAKLDAVAVDAFDDQCTGANPRYPLIAEFRAILLDSYNGKPFVELTERASEAPEQKTKAATKVDTKVHVKMVETVKSSR